MLGMIFESEHLPDCDSDMLMHYLQQIKFLVCTLAKVHERHKLSASFQAV